ncbi:transmembrane protein 222 isoform X1 [Choloepus didactylus]|uniref:transmembrane protein 222 isoform X1 n=1 Tax=Choloepus didactylus TaxID=27675 RepID=UPI00189F4ECA|nr:transmembrane protein 222 isoform X1 [Choloepus didactylus]
MVHVSHASQSSVSHTWPLPQEWSHGGDPWACQQPMPSGSWRESVAAHVATAPPFLQVIKKGPGLPTSSPYPMDSCVRGSLGEAIKSFDSRWCPVIVSPLSVSLAPLTPIFLVSLATCTPRRGVWLRPPSLPGIHRDVSLPQPPEVGAVIPSLQMTQARRSNAICSRSQDEQHHDSEGESEPGPRPVGIPWQSWSVTQIFWLPGAWLLPVDSCLETSCGVETQNSPQKDYGLVL